MSISKRLFLAILAMDAYNRGEGTGISLEGNRLGNATLITDSLAGVRTDLWAETGFSAAAYRMDGGGVDELESGQLLISYRGTDDLPDILGGWTIGAGYAAASQADLTINFYEAVAGHSIYDADGLKPIVTGHSLGGGLAGFASLLSGSEGVGYDHMPFGAAAWMRFGAHVYSTLLEMMIKGQASLDDAGKVTLELVMTLLRPQLQGLVEDGLISVVDGLLTTDTALDALKDGLVDMLKPEITDLSQDIVDALGPVLDAITPDILESWNLHIPDFDDFKGVATQAEALQYLRDGTIPAVIGSTIQWLANVLAPYTGFAAPLVVAVGTVADAAASIISAGITWAETQIDQTTLSTHGWTNANIVSRHSIALLTLLQFSEDLKEGGGSDDWTQAIVAENFLWGLYDDDLAKAAGAELSKRGAGGSQDAGAWAVLMTAALGYSSLDQGYQPFGDSGVRVLFDDLNDLGAVYANPSHDPFLDKAEFDFKLRFGLDPIQFTVPMGGVLARIVTQYAGALALYAVDLDSAPSGVDLAQGILDLADDSRTFGVDLSTVYWRDVLQTGAGYYADKMEPLDAGVLLANYLEQSEELDADILSLKLPGGSLWLGGQVNDDALNELVGWGWNASDWHAVLDRIHVRAVDGITELRLSERAYAVAAGSGNDAHVDVYVGTDAAEQITGTKGNDFILTGDGDDLVHTGAGSDFVLAGSGSDHLYDDLAAKDRDGQPRNDDDLYIGDTVDKGLFEAFADWLGQLTGGWGDHDLLEYSVADPDNPGSLAPQGIKVTGLGVVALGDLQAVSITVLDQNTGLSGTDRLVQIERVLLSERADRIDVTADMLAAPIWIDMGLGPKGGSVGKADYDTVSYAGAGKPIVTVNGTTQTGDGDNGPLTGVGYLQLISELAGAAIGLPVPATPVFSAFTANDGLRVTGAEHVVLTPNDDVLWYGPINKFVGAITGWPSGEDYPHFGQIEGGAGNDVMIVRDARYVFSGEALDPSNPDSPSAASDLRLEVDGGEGEDRVMIVGGDGGIAIGGAGRDFVFNWGYKGQLYGDTVDGKGGGQDVFWWSPGSFIMDAEQHDRLQMFGIPLTGGWGVQDGETDFVVDWLLPFVRYGYSSANQLIVSWGDPQGLAGDDLLSTAMVVNNFKFGTAKNEFMVSNLGTLGMTFRIYGHGDEISLWHSIWGFLMSQLQALQIFAKSLHWDASDDPLVLDLDGDGIETSQSDFGVQFDLDGDWFAQRSGWVGADDGLLARDLDGNGRIDDIHELFGAPGVSGFAMLATLDDNADGVIDAADAGFTTLRLWRDLDQDGLTDAGELKTLAETGITGLNTGNTVVNLTVANGNTFVAEGSFNRADGSSGEMSELVFDSNPVETLYRGDNGVAGWASPIDSKGYGKLTQLATAASNDFALNAVLQGVAASMTVGDITLLRAQAQPVFEAWADALPQSRELTPLLLDADGQLLDRGVYQEDAAGGWWTLASGAPVLGDDGSPVARPTLEAVLAQAAAGGAHWQLEQLWSPADRTAAPTQRTASPYLVQVVDGRAVVLDHGVLHSDAQGSWWTLASGQPVTDAGGATIERPQLADLLALNRSDGGEWRTELFGAAPEPFPFEKFAVRYKGGIVTDYAVQVSDAQGSFFVWANNLKLALDYQIQHGQAGGFALRQYALDLDHLKDADNSVDSYIRAEIVTASQARFAAAAYGIVIEPGIVVASVDSAGVLHYDAPIADTVDFFDHLMAHYGFFSRAAAVHLAAQGGLAEVFRGIAYDPHADAWIATSGRELAPMFEAIFERAPAGRDAAAAYLTQWGEVMDVIYPDLHRHDAGPKSEAFVLQMVVAAYDNVPIAAELLKAAEVFGVDEEKIILHDAAATVVDGTSGSNYFVLGTGNQLYRGGLGRDLYVVGKDFGHDVIEDTEPPLMPRSNDTLRFAHVKSTEVYAYKDGIDLMIQVLGTDNQLTVRNQFDGKWPSLFGGDLSPDTEMVEITFADGVSWRDLDIAWATSHPLDSDDLVAGTPAIDVLDGGRGNDILRGGRDSDLYIFDVGYGQDRIEDNNDHILLEHVDVLQFGPVLRANHLRFTRLGDADDLIISLVDDLGTPTGDRVTLTNQFDSVNTWVFGVVWLDRIERLVFADGSFLSEADVMRLAVEQARTDQEDAIFGFHAEDRLDGGLANDYLSGDDLDDTYVFDRGDGHDVIEDNLKDFLSPSYDTLQLLGNIKPDEVELLREPGSLTITLALRGSDDRVTLQNEFRLTSTVLFGDYYFDNVDEVRFIDGTVWDMDAMARMLLAQARTDGDDVIVGFDRNDVLDGGAGDDRLEGGIYSDTYVMRRGYGHDTVFDFSRDPLLAPGRDVLDFTDVAFDDLVISRFKEDLTFTVRDTGESITLAHQYNRFGGQANAVELLRFGDQVVPYTDLNPEDVDLIGTAGADTLWGTHFAETIDGLAGDDLLIGSSDGDSYRFDVGYGNDTLLDIQETRSWFNDDHVRFGADITVDNVRFSKDGNDLLVSIADRLDTLRIRDQFGSQLAGVEQFHFHDGSTWSISDVEELLLIAGGGRGDDVITGLIDRENILDGRQGDDQLFGGRAADIYVFGLGYGLDTVTEVLNSQAFAGAVDRVVFGSLVDPAALGVRRDGGDLVFTLVESGDQLRIVNGLDQRLVEAFDFVDGTLWTLADVRLAMLRGTEGDDLLVGFDDSADVLDGGFGSDELQGGALDDSYHFGIGYGADGLFDAGGAADVLQFGELITADQLRFIADGDQLVIRLAGFDDSMVLREVLGATDAAHRIELLRFADGLELGFDAVRQALVDQQATPGDDVVTGWADRDDQIGGGAGADELIGLAGNDLYRIASGGGLDLVDDRGASANDRIVFTEFSAAEAQVRRAHPLRADVVIAFAATGDELTIKGGLEAGNASAIESIEFADGTVWTVDDLRRQVLADSIGEGNDIVTGFAGADRIEAGRGDDALYGLAGSDTYVFTRGDGHDLLRDEGATADVDLLELQGYAPEDVRVLQPQPDRNDLLLVFADTADEILLRDQFGTASAKGIEQLRFGDGTVWTRADLAARITAGGTGGDDGINGSPSGEFIIGRGGDDRLSGGDGSDTYEFRRGDGHDTIEDNGAGDTDVLRFLGYAPDELQWSRALDAADTLLVRFAGSSDEIRVVNTLDSDNGDQIERFEFEDGSAFTIAQLKAMMVTPEDPLADNRLVGFDGADTMAGGLGNDALFGGDGSDTYVWRRNDGDDRIEDNGAGDNDTVQLVQILPGEVRLVQAFDAADTLELRVDGALGVLRVLNTLDSDSGDQIERFTFDDGTVWSVADVKAKLVAQQATAGNDAVTGFDGADAIDAGLGDDWASGGGGSDTYTWRGSDGADTLEDNGAGSTDVVRLVGMTPATVRWSVAFDNAATLELRVDGGSGVLRVVNTLTSDFGDQIERFSFDDGTVWTIDAVKAQLVAQQATAGPDRITGFDGNDSLDGGAGDDQASGGGGSDTYVWRAGDGNDRFEDNGAGSTDVVKLVGVLPSQVQLAIAPDAAATLQVRLAGGNELLQVVNTLASDFGDQIERFSFDDGTVWTIADVKARLVAQQATAGNDTVAGFDGSDVLDGGAGDDGLSGGGGSDSYRFGPGGGHDVIEDNGAGSTDVLRLAGVLPVDVVLARALDDPNTLLLQLPGGADSLRIVNTLAGDFGDQIERLEFDDGTVWSMADVNARLALLPTLPTVSGTAGADLIESTAATETLRGGDGSDSYVYQRGDGSDVVDDSGTFDGLNDRLLLQGIAPVSVHLTRSGNDLWLDIDESAPGAGDGGRIVVRQSLDPYYERGLERFEFDDGTVWTPTTLRADLLAAQQTAGDDAVSGFSTSETLEGGRGDDQLAGGDGNDSYVYTRGDGIDIVDDAGTFGGTADRLVLHGIDPDTVTVQRSGNDAVLQIAETSAGAGDGGRILMRASLDPYYERGLESIAFDDGALWTPATLRSMILADQLSDGDDVVSGFTNAETIQPGLGNDASHGGDGNDSYVYRRGDGDDIVDDAGTFGGTADRLLLQGISPASVALQRSGNDVLLHIAESAAGAGDGGQIVVRASLDPYYERGIESIAFDDGTVWTPATLRTQLTADAQTAGNDRLNGFVTADAFTPSTGDDSSAGGDGDDTYVYTRGDGFDLIDDSGTFGGTADQIVLHGIDPAAVSVQRSGNDAVLVIAESAAGAGDAGRLLVRQTLDPYYERGIEWVLFDDGSRWSQADLRTQLLQAENGPEGSSVYGFSANDALEGGGAADLLVGGDGNDHYVWQRGDGDDVIDDSGSFGGSADQVVLHGVLPDDAALQQGEGNDLVLVIAASAPGAGDGARLVLKASATPYFERGIEAIVFDDGTLWTQAGFAGQALVSAATDGDDRITGSTLDDRMLGRQGNDLMHGGDGSDTYVQRPGDGRDSIDDNGDGDVDVIEIRGRSADQALFTRLESGSNDLLIRFAGSGDTVTVINGLAGTAADAVERFDFVDVDSGAVSASFTLAQIAERLVLDARTAGADLISGTGAADVLSGGAGPDVLDGAGSDDVYRFLRGDGDDRIEDTGASTGDELQLPDFNPADLVSVRRSPPAGLDLVLNFESGDRVVLRDTLSDAAAGIERVRFADDTVWTVPQLRERVLQDAATDGDETVRGFAGDDRLGGGRGNDVLHGGDGSDTYLFAAGDGQDRIEDNGVAGNGGETDRIQISGYTSAQVAVSRLYKADDGIVLRFAGGDDQLIVFNTLGGGAEDGIEQIAFDDGVVWTMTEVLAALDNDAPVAGPDGFFSAVRGRNLTLQPAELLANDFDPNGDALSIVAVGGAEQGSVQLMADGTVVYTADDSFVGATRFEYSVADGHNGLATQTVTLRVRPPASATDDAGLSVAEDTLLPIRVERLLANDFDGDLMVVSQVLDAVHGSVSLASSGDISFVPARDFNGLASFRYVANTPDGGRAEATVTVAVTPVNDAPVARNDSGLTTPEGTPLLVRSDVLLRNDSDIDGDRLAISAVIGDAHVSATLTPLGHVQLEPLLDYFGSAVVTYTIADGFGGQSVASASLVVTPVNDLPLPTDDALATDEDTPLFLPVTDLLVNDSDPELDPLTVVRVFGFSGGQAELFPNGTVLFRPNDNYYGQASFRYEVDDGQGGLASARVAVQVNPLNDAPDARDDAYDGAGIDWLDGLEDQPLSITLGHLLANDRDRDSASVALATVSSAEHGSVELVDGQVVFTPDPQYWGEASFSYVLRDAEGAVDDARVTLYIAPVSDAPPVAAADEVIMYEDVTTLVPMAHLLANDTDIDHDPLIVDWVRPFSHLDAAAVSLSRNAAGDLVIAPTANVNGRVTLVYQVNDQFDGTDSAWVTVTIVPVNDDPEATDDTATTSLDAPLVVRLSDLPQNDDDLDFDKPEEARAVLHVASVQAPSVGSLWVYQDEFAVLEAPEGFSGALDFHYTLADEADGRDDGRVWGQVAAEHAAVISGSARRDLLIGTALAERLEGREGADDLFGRHGDDVLAGGDDADLLDGGEGRDTAAYDGSNIGVRADLQVRIGQGGHAQGDRYVAIENLAGSGFSDQLYGDGGFNLLAGAGGNDGLDGREGDDALFGDAGHDRLVGGAGADALDGGDDDDSADYGDSPQAVNVSLRTGIGLGGDAEGDRLQRIEQLIGSLAGDVLEGDDVANRLAGGRGADRLIGGGGDDWLEGGRDGDAFEGGEGSDTADYAASLTGVTVDLSGQSAGGGDAEGDTFSGVENIRGSFHDDQLIGDATDNRLEGGEGADRLVGGGGLDTADYRASATAVTMDLAAGTGLGGDAQGDVLQGMAGLLGSAYDDELRGDAGANVFEGGFGADLLAGGAGSDDYHFGFGATDDSLTELGEASDIDRILLDAAVRPADAGLLRRGSDLVIELEKGEGFLIDTITVPGHFDGEATGVELIVFGDGTAWSRDVIAARTRDDRFNAVNDLIRWADEDLPYAIVAGRLLGNDVANPDPAVHLVSVGNARHGSATLLDDGSVSFLGDADFNGDAYFDYTAADGSGRESTATARVIVRPVNDAPVARPEGPYDGIEDVVLSIPIATLLANDSDIDGDNLRITGFGPLLDENGQPTGPEAGIGFAFAGTHGTAMFDLFAPNVLFIPSGDYYGAAGFSYTVSDGAGGTASTNVELQFAAVNDGPRPKDDAFTTRIDRAITLTAANLTGNDIEVEGDPITLLRVHDASHGSVAMDEAGSVVFTPETGYLGSAGFAYDAGDGRGAEGSGWVEITVIPLNDPPRAGDDRFDLVEDQPLIVTPAQLLANDSDPNGDPLVVSRLDLYPEKGSVDFAPDGSIVFTPKPDYNGDASFYYWISDGRGGEDQGNVLISILPDNDPPYVNHDGLFHTGEDEPLLIATAELLANDGDPDGDVLHFVGTDAENGSLSIQADGLLFTPQRDFVGTATGQYRLADDKGGVSPTWATFSIEVSALADVPSAMADRFTLRQDRPLLLQPAQLLANDFDGDGDAIRLLGVSDAAHGSVEQLADGSIRFVPEAGFVGNAGFSYAITDDTDGEATGEVTINFTSDNNLPTANADRFSALEDTPVTVAIAELLANDSDPDGDPLELVWVQAQAEHGRASLLPGGRVVFTPDEDVTGLIRFGYQISDGLGVPVNGTVEIELTPVNDGPDAVDDTGFTVLEGGTLEIDAAGLLANDRDVEGDAFSLVGVDDLINGSVVIDGGTLRFTPDAGFYGGAAFTYLVRDVHGAEGRAQVSVHVEPLNHPPVAVGDFGFAFDEDGSLDIAPATLLANDRDDDGDAFSLTWVGSDFGGTVALLPDGQIRFTGAADFNGDASFRYRITDAGGRSGEAAVAISVQAVNDAPVAVADRASTDEDMALTLPVLALLGNDRDVDRGSFQLVAVHDAEHGQVVLDGQGNVVFTPEADYHGPAGFGYTIADLAGASASTTVAVEVGSINDAPQPQDDGPLALARDDRVVITPATLLANDRDADGDALLLLAAEGASHGQISQDADGRIVYVPDDGFVGADQFRYTAGDGSLTGQATVALMITDPYADWRQGTAGADLLASPMLVDNRVYAGSGDDRVTGGLRNDQIEGGRGDDALYGLTGNDRLGGGDGNDSLSGGAGNDVLTGGRGDDQLSGGWGLDRFVFRQGDGRDTVLDFSASSLAGNDHIDLHVPGVAGFNDVLQYAHQTDAGVLFDFGGGDTLLLRGTALQQVQHDWFTFGG